MLFFKIADAAINEIHDLAACAAVVVLCHIMKLF